MTVIPVTYGFSMKLSQFSICETTLIVRELYKIRTSFVYQIKFHLEIILPRTNKHEKKEICEKDLDLSIFKKL